jgi:hypothetical protein
VPVPAEQCRNLQDTPLTQPCSPIVPPARDDRGYPLALGHPRLWRFPSVAPPSWRGRGLGRMDGTILQNPTLFTGPRGPSCWSVVRARLPSRTSSMAGAVFELPSPRGIGLVACGPGPRFNSPTPHVGNRPARKSQPLAKCASGVRGLLNWEMTEPCRSFCAPSVRASVCASSATDLRKFITKGRGRRNGNPVLCAPQLVHVNMTPGFAKLAEVSVL